MITVPRILVVILLFMGGPAFAGAMDDEIDFLLGHCCGK